MQLTFLEASVPLTKSYAKKGTTLTKTPYPFTWEFTSHTEKVSNLAQLEKALKAHASQGHCLLKGNVSRPLQNESRAGSTDPNGNTELVVLDLDGLSAPSIQAFLDAIGLDKTSYIVQWSASYGIENKELRAHVFMMLDRAVAAPMLKQWLMQLNHDTPMLRDAMHLTKTGNMISWPLDVSACQNDKLIYIAPPVLKGLKDPLGSKPRIHLVKHSSDVVRFDKPVNAHTKNRTLTHKRLDELREAAGLPKRKAAYKTVGTTEVMVHPDVCTINDMKTERGFVYFNLNGGDSWAYYHPENNPDYIFNFKGEPAYLTKELLPEYWESLTSAGAKANSQGLIHLAFLDRESAGYWRGTYDAANDDLHLYQAKNETQIRHFCKQHGVPLGDFVPEWDLTFDPHQAVRVDLDNRVVNRFQLTEFMRATYKPTAKCPSTIFQIVSNALGDDIEIIEHFFNWLAYIVQFRDRTNTAWVWHGVPGTGKGILFDRIIRPLFGDMQTAARRMEELDEKYNGFMRDKLVVFIDEVETKALANERGVMAKMKNFITERMVAIREMRENAHEVRNYANFIMASNKPDPVLIERNDRRINVGAYQKKKLVMTDAELERIPRELQGFYNYLYGYPCDKEKAGSVLDTTDRATMISISESSVDTVVTAIEQGDFKFFMDQLPDSEAYMSNALELNKVEDYKAVLTSMLMRIDQVTGQVTISRDELRSIFNYVVGSMPTSPNKFTSLLKHHRLHISDVWYADPTRNIARTVRGVKATFDDRSQFPNYAAHFSPKGTKPGAKLKAVPK